MFSSSPYLTPCFIWDCLLNSASTFTYPFRQNVKIKHQVVHFNSLNAFLKPDKHQCRSAKISPWSDWPLICCFWSQSDTKGVRVYNSNKIYLSIILKHQFVTRYMLLYQSYGSASSFPPYFKSSLGKLSTATYSFSVFP